MNYKHELDQSLESLRKYSLVSNIYHLPNNSVKLNTRDLVLVLCLDQRGWRINEMCDLVQEVDKMDEDRAPLRKIQTHNQIFEHPQSFESLDQLLFSVSPAFKADFDDRIVSKLILLLDEPSTQ